MEKQIEYKGFQILKPDMYKLKVWRIEGYFAAYISEQVCQKVIDTFLKNNSK